MKTLPTCSEWLRSNGCLFGCVSRSTMAPTPPLPVTEDTPPDMLAGSMDLQVVLPNGKSVKMSVERSTPMMDLLVQVATINRIPPGGHVIQAIGEKGILPYKPSTPIGALDTWTIEIVPKSKLNNAIAKKAPLKPNNQQPFEQTFRLQVHLPRNQLFVTRVSSKTSLADILTHVCMEKNLDASKYELRHPANLEERLSLECSLADYKLQEVVVVARSSRPVTDVADIMALQKEEEKRRQQAKAAGGNRFFGSVFRRNHSNMGEGSISSDSLGGRSSSPARSDESASRSASPPTNSLPSLVQLPVRPQRKRRPAPKPPVLNENNMQTLKENEEKNLQNCSNNKFEKGTTLISHSRNSSDSSGYHEASVLSESPDSHTAAQINSTTDALHRRSKLTSSNHSPNQKTSDPPFFSRSLSNLATVGQYEPNVQSSMKKTSHSASTSVLSTAGQYKKKKAAPPPPPSRLKKVIPEQESPDAHNSVQCDDEERLKTSSLDRHSRTTSKDDSGIDLDRSATLPAIVKRSKFENMGSNASSEESVAKISMRSFSSNEGDIDEEEEETVVPETKSQTVRDYNHCPVVAEPEIQSRQSDPVVKAPVCLPPDVIPIVAPQPADAVDKLDTETDTIDTEETLTAFDKVINEIQYLPREDNQGRYMNDTSEVLSKNMKNMTSASLPLPVTIIPNDSKEENEDSLSIDWQYQLPAPPSAFRDTSANSPTLLEGETVVLADAEVFQENTSSLQSDVSSSSLEAPNVPEILEHKFAKSIESAVRAKDQEVLPVRISENEISRVNPLFNLHEYDNNSQRYSSGDEEKSSSGLGEDLHETCSYRKEVTEREEMRRREMSDSQRLVTNQPSYSNDNILSNFKLTTYEKPNEFDSIYHENETEFKDTSVSIPAEVFKRPSLSAKAHDSKYSSTSSLHKASVVRVDSFEKSDSKPTVKRSTSYISLQNTSKLSNHVPKTSCIPGRAQSVTNLAFEHSSSEDDSLESSYRRYSEPNDEYNHSQVSSNQSQLSKLQSEFFHFQHKLQQSQSAFNQPDVQLQSLQVLRTILPQISQTKDQIEVPNTENKVDTASTTPSNKKEEMSDNTESQPKSVKNDSVVEEKRYRYQGPPSIKLSSWNERPKMQVNIKADSDYRFGGGKEESKSMNSQVQSKAEDKSIISSIKNHLYKPGNIISTKVDNNNSLSNLRSADSARSVARDVVLEPIASHKTESNNVMNQPLIVSSIPKDPVTSIHIGSYASNNYNSSQVADPSRVPIVRAVELKKPLQRQATDPVISFINGSVVKSEDFSNNQLSNKKTDSKPGGFVGVNSLAKKFSIGVSLQNNNNSSRSFNSRPVSSYELSAKPKFDNSEVQEDNNRFHSQDNKKVLTRSSSTNLINAPSVTINSYDNNNSVRNKYTSVVGVNRTGLSSTSFREQSAVTNGSVKPLSTFVKVGNFSSSRQPMPVVKGFQIPLQPSNAPSVSVKIQHQPPVTEPDSSRKSILQKAELPEERSSIHASNGKATHPFGNQANVSSSIVKIQHHSPNNQQPLKLHKSKSLDQECVVPVPPPAPAFSNVALKKSSHPRPKSMPVLCADPRDQLMEAIRAHGGMGNLKKVRRYDSSTPNVILRL